MKYYLVLLLLLVPFSIIGCGGIRGVETAASLKESKAESKAEETIIIPRFKRDEILVIDRTYVLGYKEYCVVLNSFNSTQNGTIYTYYIVETLSDKKQTIVSEDSLSVASTVMYNELNEKIDKLQKELEKRNE